MLFPIADRLVVLLDMRSALQSLVVWIVLNIDHRHACVVQVVRQNALYRFRKRLV